MPIFLHCNKILYSYKRIEKYVTFKENVLCQERANFFTESHIGCSRLGRGPVVANLALAVHNTVASGRFRILKFMIFKKS